MHTFSFNHFFMFANILYIDNYYITTHNNIIWYTLVDHKSKEYLKKKHNKNYTKEFL